MTTAGSLEGQFKCDNQSIKSIKSITHAVESHAVRDSCPRWNKVVVPGSKNVPPAAKPYLECFGDYFRTLQKGDFTVCFMHGYLSDAFALVTNVVYPLVHVRDRQACRERAEMSLKIRSNETMMGEMAVLVRRYRHECARLHKVNRTLNDRLAEYQLQVSTRDRTSSRVPREH